MSFQNLREKIEKSSGLRSICVISIILALVITIGIMVRNSKRFENELIYGNFQGEIIFSDNIIQNCSVNLTFDGEGHFFGEIFENDTVYEITDSDYTFTESILEFSFSYDDNSKYISFDGSASNDYALIQGNVRLYESGNSIHEGTFIISKQS